MEEVCAARLRRHEHVMRCEKERADKSGNQNKRNRGRGRLKLDTYKTEYLN